MLVSAVAEVDDRLIAEWDRSQNRTAAPLLEHGIGPSLHCSIKKPLVVQCLVARPPGPPYTMQAKLAELMDFVETHMVDAARHQKQEYDKHMGIRTFKAGDLVWLSIPTAGKLDPRWEGGWKVKACKSPVNMEVSDGTRNRVVHVNRLRHRIQMAEGEEVGSTDRTQGEWVPPLIEHITVEGTPPQCPEPDLENNDQPVQPEEPIQRRYPSRRRRPPDYF